MKKKYTYIILLFSFIAFSLLIITYRKPDTVFKVQMRHGELSDNSEWLNSKAAIEELILRIKSDPSDYRSKSALGMAYIQEARISGNHSYYDNAALALFQDVLKNENKNYEALIGKATVLLSQHHFQEAIPVAEMALSVNPYSAAAYGIFTDAYVETGEYAKAIIAADKMASLRPDIRSYSRISYLREITGDYSGAIEAMKMAVGAGYPGFEQTEWCRVQLGHLYETTGDLLKAMYCFDESIYYRPSFALAYAGKAGLEKKLGNYVGAIELLNQAQTLLNDFSFQQSLTELYRLTNRQNEASSSARMVIELLGGLSGSDSQENHGHYADKELAYAYLDSYDYFNAFKHAIIEYNRRPANIEVNQALAWVNYKLGNYEDANKFIDVALSTGSKNPQLNYQAGIIKINAGFKEEGKKLIAKSTSLNPHVSPFLKWEMKKLLVER